MPLWNAEWQLKWKNVPGNDSRNLDTDLLSLHMCATTVWVRVFFCFFFKKVNLYFPCMTLHMGKRIQPQSSSLSPNGQDFLYGVKSH